MPFVQRRVEPKHLGRTPLFDDDGHARVDDDELQAVTNNTLCNALRQLASLAAAAGSIFEELGGQLGSIRERADLVQVKIRGLEARVARCDPKEVTVPESDICTFAALKRHYAAPQTAPDAPANLFAPSTRPPALEALYAAAAKTPVHLMRQLDRWRRDGRRTSGFFLCTPVLGARRRMAARGGRGGAKVDVDIDIETSVPAAVEDLRRWTSNEALGDVTVTLDCQHRITSATADGDTTDGTLASDDEGLDHKLPSPEEQVQVVALKFPAEIVAVDVSGRSFDRMSTQRRSLLPVEAAVNRTTAEPKRRTRPRKPRGRRRNTLAGTDQKEIREAVTAGEDATFNRDPEPSSVSRSKSSDLLRSSKKDHPETKRSHFNTLKQWGKTRYDRLMNKSAEKKEEPDVHETTAQRMMSTETNVAVRLRESSAQRRLRRSGGNREEPHSSSGNWSASSESGRASIGSEITTATTQPKSTTSAATSDNSLNSRRRFVNNNNNNSASSSVTSEGTLTPDIIHDLDGEETGSVYSCDTEGYYTSFHVDSGLKTLREEETPPTPLHSTSAVSAESEYELFGRGSTSTTASSAGTVVTGPTVPERKSSLTKLSGQSPESSLERDFGTVKRSPATKPVVVVGAKQKGDVSPDSGHNTSSSPIESASSPNDLDFSEESSDVEGAERIERIRVKTAIDSSRIPSMCVITPSQSDDDSSNGSGNGSRPKRLHHVITTTVDGASKVSLVSVDPQSGYATVQRIEPQNRGGSPSGGTVTVKEGRPVLKASLLPLNTMFGRLKTNLANLAHKRDRSKSPNNFDAGEYVTIADLRNNNNNQQEVQDVADRNLTSVLSGKLRDAEYVSLDELPCNDNNNPYANARVTVDAEGKIVYNSDSLRRRRNCHSTFQPGKNVKAAASSGGQRVAQSVRPVARGAGATPPAHQKERVQSPADPQQIPNATPGSTDYMSPSPQEMYSYGADRVLDMDLNRYLPNQYYLQRGSPKYSTLPSKKTHHPEVRPQRSVTPDITRGLERRADALEESPRTFYTFNKTEPDSLKISPIDPRHSGGFQSSTPAGKAAANLERQLLSPKKSTMSNEELYAVIHKSKKKMNIDEEMTPRCSPVTVQEPPRQSPESGYLGDRHKGGCDQLSSKTRPKQTSTMDFKRLLLQKSSSGSPKKVSAVEQLRQSREQIKPQPQMNILELSASPRSLVKRRFLPGSPSREQKPAAKMMSPRSQWRFASPRSDVLSSTILEDCREDEGANSSGERRRDSPKGGGEKGMPKRGGSEGESYSSASQRLYARRAEFFRSPAEKQLEQPTLETAF